MKMQQISYRDIAPFNAKTQTCMNVIIDKIIACVTHIGTKRVKSHLPLIFNFSLR